MNGRALIYGTIAIDTLITPGGQVKERHCWQPAPATPL